MFELSVACKYLLPRWRQLSVSIISLVSILVITLVVWLIVVFFSVKDGLEDSWVGKIIALTAPIRLTPTDKYYASYYYLADTISANSDYTAKSIGEKLRSPTTDPYDPHTDEELPKHWPLADTTPQGKVKDLVQAAAHAAQTLPQAKNVKISDFETSVANVRLRMLRHLGPMQHSSQQFVDQAAYLGSFDADNPVLAKALMPFSQADYSNLFSMLSILPDNITEDTPDAFHRFETTKLQQRLQNFFQNIEVAALKTSPEGWRIPRQILPANAQYKVVAQYKKDTLMRLYIPRESQALPALWQTLVSEGKTVREGLLKKTDQGLVFETSGQPPQNISAGTPLILEGNTLLPAKVNEASLSKAQNLRDIRFTLNAEIQGIPFVAELPLDRLELAKISPKEASPTTLFVAASPAGNVTIPHDEMTGDGVLLPKSFKEAGVLVGDQGYLSYQSPTPSSVQEQRIPIFVAGFYDPGIMPIGGKYILAPKELISLVSASHNSHDVLASSGLNIRFDNIKDASLIKEQLQQALEQAGIAKYWQIKTYQEFEFTKDLIQQLQSEKNLFSVISLVIIIVACSNIISMLIILVNDKKTEIGILRSMGASSASIAIIFGLCGMVMGALGSIFGILASVLTLRYINELVELIGRIQGHDLFNPIFYGHTLPSQLSWEALSFVVITTAFISLLAGIVPAIKASMLRPSAILRSE